jgi:hypothetical protein
MPAVPDVNLDENVEGSPYDVCLWHFSDIPPALTNVRYRR